MVDLNQQLDALGTDASTRRALLHLAAVGMPAPAIDRLARQRARGLKVYLAGDPGQATPSGMRELEGHRG